MRTLLVDDHPLFAQGLRFLLEDLDDRLVCTTAHNIAEAVQAPGPFDLILLDYTLSDSHGSEGLVRVLTAHEGATVAMLSGAKQASLVHELVEKGAAGFISKSDDTITLLKALEVMLAGGVYLPPWALEAEAVEFNMKAMKQAAAGLPPRQLECLLKMVQGKPNKTIAREMDVADSTVKSHLGLAFKALGVSNRAEAVYRVAQLGLLPPTAD